MADKNAKILKGPRTKTPVERIIEYYQVMDPKVIREKAVLLRATTGHHETKDGDTTYCAICGPLMSPSADPICHPWVYIVITEET